MPFFAHPEDAAWYALVMAAPFIIAAWTYVRRARRDVP